MRLLLILAFAIPAWCQCPLQTINLNDPKSTGPAKLNSNFNCLNTSKIGGSGTTGNIPKFTGAATIGGAVTATDVIALFSGCSGVLYLGADGACHTSGAGGGTVTVAGGGNLGSTQCVTGGGLQTAQTPSSNCTIDASGTITANSFASGDTSHSGGSYYQGLTSGGVMLAVADIAGTAIVYVLPSTNGVSGQFLKDNGVVACPTLATGAPSVCHQLTWATGGGGGSGCVPSGSSGQILVDDGAGACNSATPTISGSTITASLTGHASLDVPTSTTLTGGAGIAAIGDLSTNRTIATASGEADFLASGALTCGAATQGKMQVHTTPLQYCDNAATPTLRYAAYGDSAGAASAVAVGSITGLGTGVATALAANVSGTGAICLASGSACSGGGGSGALVLIEQHAASNSASLDFTTCISSTYDTYQIELIQIIPASAGILEFRVSTDGGSSYDSGSNYAWAISYGYPNSGSGGGSASSTQGQFRDVSTTLTSGGSWNGTYKFYNPGSAAAQKTLSGTGAVGDSGVTLLELFASVLYKSNTAVNAFQFFQSTGNLTSGTIRCYGVAKT